MRAWARTARPIGGVKVATPTVHRLFVVDEDPITLTLAATVLDNRGGLLSAAIPLEIKVTDALGGCRDTTCSAPRMAEGQFSREAALGRQRPGGQVESHRPRVVERWGRFRVIHVHPGHPRRGDRQGAHRGRVLW